MRVWCSVMLGLQMHYETGVFRNTGNVITSHSEVHFVSSSSLSHRFKADTAIRHTLNVSQCIPYLRSVV